jgi:hypothetical protein
VLDLLFRGGEGRLVLDMAQRQVSPSLEEQVGVALSSSDRLDEEVSARLGLDKEGRRSSGIHRGRRHLNGL